MWTRWLSECVMNSKEAGQLFKHKQLWFIPESEQFVLRGLN